jgi:hypothetical protein
MTTANTFDFITYMYDCAARLKDIEHSESNPKFFRISGLNQLDEVLGSLSEINFPALLVHDNTEGTIADQSVSNNYLDSPYYVFYVIEHADVGNYQAQQEAKTNCKALGLKILSRMLRDKIHTHNGLTFLQFTNIPYQSIGPVGDNCFGVMFSFTVPDTANLTYNTDDWREN